MKENGKDAVEVFCRIRPLRSMTELLCVKKCSDTVLQLVSPSGSKSSCYNFKHIFEENVGQEQVFSSVCLPLVKDLLDAKNGLLFTYGITSSGKTHTITGSPQNCGILPRSLDALFNSIRDNRAQKYIFKPDGQNGFEIQTAPDAILQWQTERNTPKPPATPLISGRSARQRRQDANDLKEWTQRTKDTTVVQLTHKHNAFAIFVSYVEIYNNYIYDLLDDSVMDQLRVQKKQPPSKFLREDAGKRVFVQGCSEVEVTSSDEAFEVFLKGIRRRKIAHTALNTESSRSHSVFSIRVVQSPMDADGEVQNNSMCVVSQLSLVDLAGSERTNRTGTTGERLKEASNINNSLMSLRNCLDILRENQKNKTNKVVPYRENKLTHLFKNYFEGEGHVSMIICLNPSADEYDETVHVLKFAETTQEVLVTRPNDYQFQFPFKTANGVQFASCGQFGPSAPKSTLIDPNDEKVIPEWLEFLDHHKNIRLKKTEELLQNQLVFREQVGDMEKEVLFLRQQNLHLTSDLSARQEQVMSLQSQVNVRDRDVDSAQRAVSGLEKRVTDLEGQLKSSREATNRAKAEKEDLKKQHMETLRLEQKKIRKFYEDKMAEIEAQLKKENFFNVEKMDLIRQIISGSSDVRSLQETIVMRPSSPPSNLATASASTGSTAPKAPSTPVSGQEKRRSSRAASQDRGRRLTEQRKSAPDTPVTLSGTKSPELLPVMNPRHRRSLSTGNDKWLDHRPSGTLDLGTVFQPKIKNKKSFSNMREVTAETFNHASHYALTHHMADASGEVETRVYKGDIIPSTGGGAHVIFNDVETLTQEDPLSPGLR